MVGAAERIEADGGMVMANNWKQMLENVVVVSFRLGLYISDKHSDFIASDATLEKLYRDFYEAVMTTEIRLMMSAQDQIVSPPVNSANAHFWN